METLQGINITSVVEDKETIDRERLMEFNRKAYSILNNEFLLSEKGRRLKQEIEEALDNYHQNGVISILDNLLPNIPTVENPQDDLYRELSISEEDSAEIFGENFDCIQLSTGCSYRCNFCAAWEFDQKLLSTPFQLVRQYAKEIEKYEDQFLRPVYKENQDEIEKAWLQWKKLVKEEFDIDLDNKNVNFETVSFGRRINLFYNSDLCKFYGIALVLMNTPNSDVTELLNIPTSLDELKYKKKKSLHLYYESDISDYFDKNFRHEDGREADFVDILELFDHIDFIKHDITMQVPNLSRSPKRLNSMVRFAEYLKKSPNLLLRISINWQSTHARKAAEKDYQPYLENVKLMIDLLNQGNCSFQLLFSNDKLDPENEKFEQKVLGPLENYIETMAVKRNKINIISAPVSRFSGKITEQQGKVDEDHDIMACMIGYHLRYINDKESNIYKAIVLKQEVDKDGKVPKGGRPREIGLDLLAN